MDWNLLRYFDPDDDYFVKERQLPHWSQTGSLVFDTFRLRDSIPDSARDKCLSLIRRVYLEYGVDFDPQQPSPSLEHLRPGARHELRIRIDAIWNRILDQGYGSCLLRRPSFAKIVSEALHHYDGVEYRLTDFVVMPNHVHLIAAFASHELMLKSLAYRKRFSASRINQQTGQRGRLWHPDGFDHLVRSETAFLKFRRYIAANPRRAQLKSSEYLHYSRDLEGLGREKVR